MDGAKTKEDWEKARPRLKREFLEMLGLDPLPEKTPLKATVTGTIERGGVIIEKVHYQSKPGLYVTGNLYCPKRTDRGEGGRSTPRSSTSAATPAAAATATRPRSRTTACGSPERLRLPGRRHAPTRRDRRHPPRHLRHRDNRRDACWWHSRGYTPAGVECWNGVRGIDYLVSRPEVDAERIGVTGISRRRRDDRRGSRRPTSA